MRNITAENLIKSNENLFVCEGTIDQTNEKGKVIYGTMLCKLMFFWIIHIMMRRMKYL